jgi:uncharacterized damage-inducible protein DinB
MTVATIHALPTRGDVSAADDHMRRSRDAGRTVRSASMDSLDAYRAQARYNTWMNAKLYATSAELTDDERRRELGAFFGSVHRTLNHLILCDYAWMLRFAPDLADAVPRDASGNPIRLTSLDSVLYDEFDVMRSKRVELDRTIEQWVAGLSASDLDADMTYKSTKGVPYRHVMWWALTHFFNHQTHHRGQATTLLSQLGRDVGITDLLIMLRDD